MCVYEKTQIHCNIGSVLFHSYQNILLTVNMVSLRHMIFTTFCTHRHPCQQNLDGVHMSTGAIRVLRSAVGVGVSDFTGKRRYGGVRVNVISVTMGWVGVQCPENNVT